MTWPYSPCATTVLDAFPGDDSAESARIVAGEIGDAAALAVMPSRGPGADQVGRTMALMSRVDSGFSIAAEPSGWRLASGQGRDVRRALAWLDEDLDRLEAELAHSTSPIKVSLAGPWTLGASVELASGEKVIRDPGAMRDVVAALALGAAEHLRVMRARFPSAALVLQLDEPALPAVLGGAVPTASGWQRYRAVDVPVVSTGLAAVFAAAEHTVLHVRGPRTVWELADNLALSAWTLDLSRHHRKDDDVVGNLLDSGRAVIFNITVAKDLSESDQVARGYAQIVEIRDRLSFAPDWFAARVALAPTGESSGESLTDLREALAVVREIGRRLCDAPSVDPRD